MLARTPKPSTSDVIREAVELLGKPFQMQPLPMIGKKTYAPEPCGNPRNRLGGLHHTPHCMCGWPMGAHSIAALDAAKAARHT